MRSTVALCMIGVAVGLAGCGESAPSAAPQASAPVAGKHTPASPGGRSNEATGPATAANAASGSGAEAISRRAQQPCDLVSRAEASAIVKQSMLKPVTASQGPTCIYQTREGKRLFSVAVQSVDFKTVRKQLRGPQRMSVAKQPGYCATSSQPTLFVPLDGGRVLTVAGPCAIAKQFAQIALRELSS